MSEKLMLARADQVTFGAPLREVWSQLWFQDKPTSPLEITRMGIGAALLLHYGLATPYLLKFWGDDGWMPRSLLAHEINDPWEQSVFFYFTAPWQWYAFHAFFLFCCAAFMLGWRTSWVKWPVLTASSPTSTATLSCGLHRCLPVVDFMLCTGRTRNEFGQSAPGPLSKAQKPRS
jgi:hypothetical protein